MTAPPDWTTPNFNTTTTTQKPETPPPDSICSGVGLVLDPESEDCTGYYNCIPGEDGWVVFPGHCEDGLVFDPSIQACNWPDLVPSCDSFKLIN